MIRIQEYLNKDSSDNYWNQLLEDYWKEFNPQKKLKKVEYYESSLIKKCNKYCTETNTYEYIKIYANKLKRKAKRHRDFFEYLKDQNYTNLKRIVCAKPNEFDLINTEILDILVVDDLYIINANGSVKQTAFGKLISDNFLNYKKFRSSLYAIDLYKSMGFEKCYCPYCNDNKVSIVKDSAKTNHKLYFQLDHFYSKSKNPYFAVSFFNLIPSCSLCNSTEKGDKDFSILTHIHPYHESFNDIYRFEVPLESLSTSKVSEFLINHITKPHDLTIKDLNIDSRYVHNIDKIEKLIKIYLNNYKKDPRGLKELIFEVLNVPETVSDILKKENGKFLKDIASQLDEGKGLLYS